MDIREGHKTAAAPASTGPRAGPDRGRFPIDMPLRGGARRFVRPRVLHALVRPLWIVAICCLIAGLHLARGALVPIALALLVSFVLSGIVEWFRRHGIPRGLSATVLLIAVVLALSGVIELTWSPAQHWMQDAPHVLQTIERKARPAQSLLRRLDSIAQRATALANSDGRSAAPDSPGVAAPSAPAVLVTPLEVFAATGWMLLGVSTVVAFALLLLIAGPPTLARMTVLLAANLRAVHALEMIDAIRFEVGRYYGTLLLINIGFGTVVAAVMRLLGMPNPLLWGVIAGVLNFVPFLGSATTFTIVTVVALVSFNTITPVLLVAGSYLLLAAIEGHIIEPIFLGRSLDLSPLVVLTAIWLGGWLWGIPGMVLALPVVVAARCVRRVSSRAQQPPLPN